MIILRPYQADGVQKIRDAFASGFKSPLYVAPTGSGKTRIFSHIAQSSERRGRRALILCHRIELVDQIVQALHECDVTPEIIAASYRRSGGRSRVGNRAVAVASVQTLIRRLGSYAPPTLIIADEAHHFANGNTFSQIVRHYSHAKILGTTATPCRLDGRGLGAHFDTMIVGPTPEQLIEAGYLVRTRIFCPRLVDTSGLFLPGHVRAGDCKIDEAAALVDTPSITGNALQHYLEHTPHEQGLAFCTSVQHAENVAQQFRAAGIPALSLNGGTDKQVRRMTFADFRARKILLLTSCDIFSEGVDCPGARVGIMLRPTQSLTLYRQQKGRLTRPDIDKPYATLLDAVQNATRPGFELAPDETDEWQLTADKLKRKKKAPGIRICPKCFAASPALARVCVNCSHVFAVASRPEIEEREGRLEELTAEELARRHERRQQGQTKTLQDLILRGRQKGYKDPERWAMHVFQGREAKRRRQEQPKESV